jgi:CxxC-x17-CxxC domain-containing protein
MMIKKTKTAKDKKQKPAKISVEDLLGEVLARFDVIGEKLDTLLTKSSAILSTVGTEKDPGFKTEATVTKKFPIPRDNGPRERKMHKAVCAECNADCEVPFVPRPDRPVYCKSCYSGRRNANNTQNIPNRDEIVAEIARTFQIDVTAPPKAQKAKSKKPTAKVSKVAKSSGGKKTKAKKTKSKK